MTEKEYTATDVIMILQRRYSERTKLNYSWINYYKRNRLVVPSGKQDHRACRSARYHYADIIRLAAIIELTDRGVSVSQFRDAILGDSEAFTECGILTGGDETFSWRLRISDIRAEIDAILPLFMHKQEDGPAPVLVTTAEEASELIAA